VSPASDWEANLSHAWGIGTGAERDRMNGGFCRGELIATTRGFDLLGCADHRHHNHGWRSTNSTGRPRRTNVASRVAALVKMLGDAAGSQTGIAP